MMEIFTYEFMRHALLAGFLASISCGIIGSYVVIKRIVFISGGIAHTAYGGIGLGYFLGINPMLGALGFTVLSAIGMGIVSDRSAQRSDTIIGVMWAAGMALGIVFVSLSPGYTTDLMSYLFGNILVVPVMDIWLMLALNLIIVITVIALYEELKTTSFDEEFARTAGLNTRLLNLVLLVLIALTIIVLIRAVGIILVIALLTIPAATAGRLTSSLKHMMIIAIILGMLFTSGGLLLSYVFDLPSGATIILLAGIVFVLVSIFLSIKEKRPAMMEKDIGS
ncbi:MAG: metal ABC transporter permease [Syntrophomonadaceae bacterium]|nr:metal ABC transporter permease [Syntrophomonadaceae bacterium]